MPENEPAGGPPWRTEAVLDICRKVRETRDYAGLFPILADALEEGGFDDALTLGEMRRPAAWPDGPGDRYPNAVTAERMVCEFLGGEYAASVEWITRFAAEFSMTYNQLVRSAAAMVETDWPTVYSPPAAERAGERGREEFWDHYAVARGVPAGTDLPRSSSVFECGCG